MLWHACRNNDWRFFDRVRKADFSSVQMNRSVFVGAIKAIFNIAFYGALYRRQLHPDLVMSACLWQNFQQEVFLRSLQQSIIQNSVFRIFFLCSSSRQESAIVERFKEPLARTKSFRLQLNGVNKLKKDRSNATDRVIFV